MVALQGTRLARILLLVVGYAMIAIGMGTSLYSHFVLRPKIAALPGELDRNLESIERAVAALEGSDEWRDTSVAMARSGAAILSTLPSALAHLQNTLKSSSKLLSSASGTATEVSEGVTGLVAPDAELKRNAQASAQTARHLDLLVQSLGKVRRESAGVLASSRALSNRLSKLDRAGRNPAAQATQDVRTRVQRLRAAMDEADLPMHVSLGVIGVGGLYIFLGIVSLALAAALGTRRTGAAGIGSAPS